MKNAHVHVDGGFVYITGPLGQFCKDLTEATQGWRTLDMRDVAASLTEQCGAPVDPQGLATALYRRVESDIDPHWKLGGTEVERRFAALRRLIRAGQDGDPLALVEALELCR